MNAAAWILPHLQQVEVVGQYHQSRRRGREAQRQRKDGDHEAKIAQELVNTAAVGAVSYFFVPSSADSIDLCRTAVPLLCCQQDDPSLMHLACRQQYMQPCKRLSSSSRVLRAVPKFCMQFPSLSGEFSQVSYFLRHCNAVNGSRAARLAIVPRCSAWQRGTLAGKGRCCSSHTACCRWRGLPPIQPQPLRISEINMRQQADGRVELCCNIGTAHRQVKFSLNLGFWGTHCQRTWQVHVAFRLRMMQRCMWAAPHTAPLPSTQR